MFWKLPNDRSWKSTFRSPLTVGTCFTISVTLLGVGYAIFFPKPSQSSPLASQALNKPSKLEMAKSPQCQTIVRDPNPPLNVRSSPVAAKDNVVGTLKNGTVLTVVNENEGWFQISQPTRGWIYQDLVVISCQQAQNSRMDSIAPKIAAEPSAEVGNALPMMSGDALLTSARDRFHSGDLQGAIDRLNQVSAEDIHHGTARALLKTMPEEWNSASNTYRQAEVAVQSRRPQVVLSLVEKIPDIRYWRSRMTPLVKQAIAQQQGDR